MFSHKFVNIPLRHLIDWTEGTEDLEFKLKTVKNGDGEYEYVKDTFINNILFRSGELEHMGLYDMTSQYELKCLRKIRVQQFISGK